MAKRWLAPNSPIQYRIALVEEVGLHLLHLSLNIILVIFSISCTISLRTIGVVLAPIEAILLTLVFAHIGKIIWIIEVNLNHQSVGSRILNLRHVVVGYEFIDIGIRTLNYQNSLGIVATPVLSHSMKVCSYSAILLAKSAVPSNALASPPPTPGSFIPAKIRRSS